VSSRARRLITGLFLLAVSPPGFALVGVVAFGLGLWGMTWYLPNHNSATPATFWNSLYGTFQLFLIDSAPIQNGGPFPPPLEIARFLAPLATLSGVVGTTRALLADRLRARAARRAVGHTVVCGPPEVAELLADRLRVRGPVVVIDTPPVDYSERAPTDSTPRVVGDPFDPDVLRAAGVPRASALYLCFPSSATNAALAFAARSLLSAADRSAAPFTCHARVSDVGMVLALRTRAVRLTDSRFRLNFFTIEQLAAQRLVQRRPPAGGTAPVVIVVGLSGFGRALVVELARAWRAESVAAVTGQLSVYLLGEHAPGARAELGRAFRAVAEACELIVPEPGGTTETDLEATLDGVFAAAGDRPVDIYVCEEDEEHGLTVGTSAAARRSGRPGSTTVCIQRGAELARAFEETITDADLTDPPGGADGPGSGGGRSDDSAHLFAILDSGCDPERIDADSLIDTMARAIHAAYLAERVASGLALRDPARPSLVPWSELSPRLADSNREQAAALWRRLRDVGCVVAPWDAEVEAPADIFTAEEIDRLASDEHERWMGALLRQGTTYGEIRTDTTHPDLLDWAELPESVREQNRRAIRELPGVLGAADLMVLRTRR
jgi:TrkA-N domain